MRKASDSIPRDLHRARQARPPAVGNWASAGPDRGPPQPLPPTAPEKIGEAPSTAYFQMTQSIERWLSSAGTVGRVPGAGELAHGARALVEAPRPINHLEGKTEGLMRGKGGP